MAGSTTPENNGQPSIAALLDEIDSLVSATPDGPWVLDGIVDSVWLADDTSQRVVSLDVYPRGDNQLEPLVRNVKSEEVAQFVARSRDLVARMSRALRAVDEHVAKAGAGPVEGEELRRIVADALDATR